jgi:hypothetical protein
MTLWLLIPALLALGLWRLAEALAGTTIQIRRRR